MRILVVSLLRLGDVIMSSPTVSGLRKKYPTAEIDILLNEQFKFVGDILSGVNSIYSFPRKALQNDFGNSATPLFQPYDELKDLIESLQARKYDLVVNLTHTRLSGFLVSLIEGGDVRGLQFSQRGEPIFGSEWFRYLNDANKPEFHFSDIQRYGAGIKTHEGVTLVRSLADVEKVEKILPAKEVPIISVQVFTSDIKKDIPLSELAKAIEAMSQLHEDAHFILLGAPNESNAISLFAKSLISAGIPLTTFACSLGEALAVLDRSDVLLTGDTSIKHIASGTSCRIVEVCLGSSRPFETGSLSENTIVVTPVSKCYPCVHSKDCSELDFPCKGGATSELMAMLVSCALLKRYDDLGIIANEFKDTANIFRTRILKSGFWVMEPFFGEDSEVRLERLLDKLSLKMLLNREPDEFLAEYGTEGDRLFSDCSVMESVGNKKSQLDHFVTSLQERARQDELVVERLGYRFSRVVRCLGEQAEVDAFDEDWSEALCESRTLSRMTSVGDGSIDDAGPSGRFRNLRKVQTDIIKAKEINEIEIKLLRALKIKNMER